MKYEDLSFTVNKDGVDLTCDVLSVVPNEENENEPYVVFTDYLLDENNEFILQYGKVIEVEGEYVLKNIEDETIIEKIKNALNDDVVNYVNTQIQDSIHD